MAWEEKAAQPMLNYFISYFMMNITFHVYLLLWFLTLQNEESTIEGTISEEPLNFQVTLYSVDLLMEASNLTDTLSMHVDDVKPLLLNFPIGSLGNLMFFYYQNEF